MNTWISKSRALLLPVAGALLLTPLLNAAETNPFVGRWALTIPGGGAGWLGITHDNGFYDASILWGGGSVVPVSSVFFNDGSVYILRLQEVKRQGPDGKVIRTQQFPEVIEGKIDGNEISLIRYQPNSRSGEGMRRETFSGKRIPDLPAKPDLGALKFGPTVLLFNGKNLDGWRLTNPNATSGWSVKNGVLANNPVQEEGKPHINYGNLRTDGEFEDFRLSTEVSVPENGNSGIYLRGIYEVQVMESFGRSRDSHHMGAVYSRITPKVSAEKPADTWQTLDITLVDRHVTVKLNDVLIIDNEPLLGCTGGAMWSDEFRPGPIYLQGDHTGVSYRNMRLTPILK